MSVTVRIPGPLRQFTGGQGKLDAEAGPLREILTALCACHEGLRPRVFDAAGEVHPVLCVFVDDTDVRGLAGLESQVAAGQTVSLLLPVAGA